MKYFASTSFVFSLLLVFTSCGGDDFVQNSSGLDYIPLEIGKFWEYKVDSLIIDDLGESKIFTSSFYKETITQEIIDGSDNSSFLVELAWKQSMTDDYQVVQTFSLRDDKGSILKTVNNLEFLLIQAPLDINECWDGILFDDKLIVTVAGNSIEQYKSWNFKAINEFGTEVIGATEYDRVLTVQQADDENKIERRLSTEKYQRGLGMIERFQVIMDTQCIEECEGQAWEDKAEVGFLARTELIGHN